MTALGPWQFPLSDFNGQIRVTVGENVGTSELAASGLDATVYACSDILKNGGSTPRLLVG